MIPYTRNMHQVATYWPPAVNDGMGGFQYGEGVLVQCRWQDRTALVRNAQGQEVAASSIVYVDQALLPQGLLALGDHRSAPSPRSVASEIISVGSSPSLRATQVLHKVWL